MTKNLKKSHAPVPTLIKNNKHYITDHQKAEALAEHYEKIHNTSPNTQEQQDIQNEIENYIQQNIQHTPTKQEIAAMITSPRELSKIMQKLPNNKAPGEDTIDYKLLKNLPIKAIVQLTYIINAIMKLQKYPQKWKHSIIIPIQKKGKEKSDPSSYRPISLLNTMGKITEKVILKKIMKAEKKLQINNSAKFGFKPGHNTTQQAVRIVNDVIKGYNKEQNTVLILLDIEKAFDTVWQAGLLYKTMKYNYPAHITNIINSYLQNRTLQVKINSAKSTTKRINAGVPQGSVLGPQLFNTYINDITTTPNTKIALYADDTAIYSTSYYAQASRYLLQIQLNNMKKYYDKWKFKINETKTEAIIFSRKFTNNKIITPIKFNGHTLQPKNAVKYLGITLDKTLHYNHHINAVLQKAHGATRSMYPLLAKNSPLDQKTKQLIYTVILRPILTYAAPVWSSASVTAKRKLQTYQNKMLRLITNSDRYTRIENMHRETHMPYLNDYINNIAQQFYKKKT